MSVTALAKVFYGVRLSEKAAMQQFGAKYETRIKDSCEDSHPNPDSKPFCGNCGEDLKYKERVGDGIEELCDLEGIVKKEGLQADCDLGSEGGALIGRQLASSGYGREGSSLHDFKYDDSRVIKKVGEGLKRLGIKKKPSGHLLFYIE